MNENDELEELTIYPNQVYALKELMEIMYKQEVKVYKKKESFNG